MTLWKCTLLHQSLFLQAIIRTVIWTTYIYKSLSDRPSERSTVRPVATTTMTTRGQMLNTEAAELQWLGSCGSWVTRLKPERREPDSGACHLRTALSQSRTLWGMFKSQFWPDPHSPAKGLHLCTNPCTGPLVSNYKLILKCKLFQTA